MKPLLFCCCIFLFCRCTNEVFNPVDLFVIRDSIKDLSLSQQKARIKYGEMLQVQVKNDSLVMPIITGECPLVYKAYVQDFVRIMNAHLKKTPLRLRFMILGLIQTNSIKKQILLSSIKIQNDKFMLALSKKEAKNLRLEKEYNEIIQLLKQNLIVPCQLLDNQDLEPDISIFCDFRLLNEELSPVFTELKLAFYDLNKTYMHD
ncbi:MULTISPECIES: hypothetical protein [Butyricimonas]|uniref:hypothetical protein n=1 Tax=Butyricimonas TaxID=574697 RepID=UPI001D08DBCA|nr:MULTISPECIES: hypothetical protein [Butyricimonas]MCB6972995.1 hypothetical protein [Butyricimonas synergistica]MCG4518531.1 hypothetical protein [Butyricimonas sp. DFI.6.44]